MHGNVSEMCSDWYDLDAYSPQIPQLTDPQGPTRPCIGKSKVRRGGNWFTKAEGCRSASTDLLLGHTDNVGFRVVCIQK